MRAPAVCLLSAMRLLILPGLLGGCVYPPSPSLSQQWMIGIEPMVNDPLPMLPWTNRFLADLAAMPNTQVVYVGTAENAFLFQAWRGNRLRVMTSLRTQQSCMAITYRVVEFGQIEATFGLLVPPLAAGTEPNSACVDRAASDFYAALVVQGL